ncbi:restriction endonuclease subunit S [Erwinia billingiae]|uniref:restriction endonuclease subunit S n=1 Tax=Erwinia billingiae TaxID=182337 RepID=UPI000D002416|nr:restriction endonuclease subunit S [Erwinia billingiae]PRB59658.1 restriction endonuclease [Erwinia billingiae]
MSTVSEQNMIQGKGIAPIRNKNTEAGTIPEDWVVNSLGKMLITSPSYGINAPAVKLNTSTPVYIRITDISEDGYFKPSEKVGVDSQLSHLYILHEGDLVLARTGASVGKSYLYRPEDGHLVYAGFLIKISPNQSILNSNFLFQYMKTQQYWNWIATNSMRSGQPGVNGKEFGSLPVVVPPLKEQTAIANVLSDTDALITQLEQLIAKKQDIKTATMQQLLTGRTRLTQFTKNPDGTLKGHRPSELGSIPEDWEAVPFKDVLTIKHGKNQKEVESPSGQYPIYATGGQIGNATSFLFDKPSVLIGRKGTIDKPKYADTPFWTVDTLFYSEIKKNACVKFIYYKFCMIDWMQYNEASGVPSLNAHTIENVLVVLPNMEEQTAIATILSEMDAELEALEQKLSKARDIKQGMMQQLLTGLIRLPLDQQP